MVFNSKSVLKKKSFLIFLILGILTTSFESNSLATNQHQWAAAYLSWGTFGSSVSFENSKELSQKLTIHEISDDIFWATQWSTGSKTAYGGIQSSGHLNFDGVGQKIGILSVWDARVVRIPAGSVCQPFYGEGVGYSCRRAIDFNQGSTLNLKFRLTDDAFGSWLSMDVNLDPSGESINIGQILIPHSDPIFRGTSNFIEYYGRARSCDDVPLGSATFSPPFSPSAGALNFSGFRMPDPSVACVSAAADSPPIGQSGDVTLRFGGKDRSSSVTTTTTTTTIAGPTQTSKIGEQCKLLNARRKIGGKNATCRKVKKRLIWTKS